jgi:hypothetical protein
MELAGSYCIIDMVIYCQDCGKPNSYGSSRPSFCQGCGTPLGKTKGKPRKTALSRLDDDDPETTDAAQVPNITRLEVEIDTTPRKGVRIEDVVGTSNPDGIDDDRPIPPDGVGDISTDDFMKQFKREAGALKPKA